MGTRLVSDPGDAGRQQKDSADADRSAEDHVSLSLTFVLTFTAIIRFGPSAGVLVGAIGSLSNGLFPKRQPWHQIAFNVALTMLGTWASGLGYLALNDQQLFLRVPQTYLAVVAASLCYFVLNTGGVATIVALCTEQNPIRLWKGTFLWTAPSYLAGACASTMLMMLFGRHAGIILLFISPVIYAAHQFYATTAARSEEKQQHIEELQLSQEHLADLYLATIKSLALAIDAKDQYTHQHILRVQHYAVATAQHMGITGVELEAINTGALLHDIGKLGVPEYVLLKPGRLTDEEFAKIKKHPEIGAAILDLWSFPGPSCPLFARTMKSGTARATRMD